MKKYEFTGETMEFEGHTLKRIRYLRHVGGSTMKGDVGGWLESEENLSQEGECVVRNNAKVFGHARITEFATVSSNATVKDNVHMKGDSYVSGDAIIGADTILDDDAWVIENSKVFFYADENYGQPNVYGDSTIWGETIIEATGYIRESEIKDFSLFGHLVVANQTLGKVGKKYKN